MLTRQPYAFSVGRTDAYCVVRAAGELDIAAVPHLRTAVHAARRHAGHVVVDLRDVSFIDGFALHALTELQDDRSGRPSLHVVPGPGIQGLLDLTGARGALDWISAEQLSG
jgi:anti-anti-sigma factor